MTDVVFSREHVTEQFIRDELIYLWHLLGEADDDYRHRPYAKPGSWSGRCEGLAERITIATALVGPVSWRNIGMTRLVSGWFAETNERIGLTADLPNPEQLEKCREVVDRQRRDAISTAIKR